jgi:hypothetical protein
VRELCQSARRGGSPCPAARCVRRMTSPARPATDGPRCQLPTRPPPMALRDGGFCCLSAGRKPPPRGQRKQHKRNTPSRHISKGAALPNTAACTADHGPRQAPFLPPAALGAGDLAGLCGVARRCRRLARRQATQPAPGPKRRRARGLRPTGLLSTYV